MIFEKQAKNNKNKTHFYKSKTGPVLFRHILGPIFNLYLDQFLTYIFFVVSLLAETPIFIVFSANMQNSKKHKKEKDTICEHSCANCLVKMSVFFLHFC